MKKNAFLLLGSNLGDRKKNLLIARNAIEISVGPVLKASSIYQTEAWGKTDQPAFLNQALKVHTNLSPEQVLEGILKIEQQMGRTRDVHWGERIMDIDILLYENGVVSSSSLTIPHPELQNRRFALEPLAEIAGDEIHPILRVAVTELLKRCSDALDVRRIEEH
jgi:2-amino-4-hydroxy-6-hydroxymethyldihydropteridine diphosphokinase